jgi:hypothetical protein
VAGEKANEVPAADQAGAGVLVDSLAEATPLGCVLYFGAGLVWLAVALAVVAALSGEAPWPVIVLMGLVRRSSHWVTRPRPARSGWGCSSPARGSGSVQTWNPRTVHFASLLLRKAGRLGRAEIRVQVAIADCLTMVEVSGTGGDHER